MPSPGYDRRGGASAQRECLETGRQFMTPGLVVVLLGAVVAGCASLSDKIATRPPQGRSAASVAQDEAACTADGKGQPKHQGDHYQACMMARGYATNVNMDNLR